MIFLNAEQVKHLHQLLIDSTGGLSGLRDESLLLSALAAPFQTFDGVELYPTPLEKIARTAYGLVRNHPFLDGNKRIGTYVMLVLLDLNQIHTRFSDEDIIHTGIALATGEMTDRDLLRFIQTRLI